MSPDHIPAAVRLARLDAGLSQRELAELAGTSRAWVAAVERGACVPSVGRLVDLARALGVTPQHLLQQSDNAPAHTNAPTTI
jgi:transcriptional regulator with XRE-family HTH domain